MRLIKPLVTKVLSLVTLVIGNVIYQLMNIDSEKHEAANQPMAADLFVL